MTSTSDLILIQKYKTMLGLDQIDNISDINKVFNISQITNLQTYLNTLVNITLQWISSPVSLLLD